MSADLVQQLGKLLAARQANMVTAESCTGGWIAKTITDAPGVSSWFQGGLVTYSNELKTALLGVPDDLIAAYGAVSEQVAAAMAMGAVVRSESDLAVSVSGIAGPDGGSVDKPVGTVCFGWCLDGDQAQVSTRHFDGDREAVRWASVIVAIEGCIELLQTGRVTSA